MPRGRTPKLKLEDVAEVRRLFVQEKRTDDEIAGRYGVSPQTLRLFRRLYFIYRPKSERRLANLKSPEAVAREMKQSKRPRKPTADERFAELMAGRSFA